MPHTVLKVGRLFANEAWILDTAGCQYGFREVLVPFEKYLADKSCQVLNEPTTYDATETKDLDYFSTLPFLNRTRAQREDKKAGATSSPTLCCLRQHARQQGYS